MTTTGTEPSADSSFRFLPPSGVRLGYFAVLVIA
jgi:hypothetical protein